MIALLAVCLSLGCKKSESTDSAPPKPDKRLNETGHWAGLDWPPAATTTDAAIAEVTAKLGPASKAKDGSSAWASLKDAEHCNFVTIKDDGGKPAAMSQTMLKAHPDFAECARIAAEQNK